MLQQHWFCLLWAAMTACMEHEATAVLYVIVDWPLMFSTCTMDHMWNTICSLLTCLQLWTHTCKNALCASGQQSLRWCETAQHSITQHATASAQHSSTYVMAQVSTARDNSAQRSTAQHSTARHSIAQAQHSTAQHSTATAQHGSPFET